MSLEYRVRFLAPDNYDPLIAYNINQSGLVFFLDGGNAYNWFVPQGDTQINSASEFFKSVAVAGGFGYRYSTPIGPLRLDFAWPLYDPHGTTDVKLGNFQFHVAFGHAF
jgi:outer membrane protein insertion porin family